MVASEVKALATQTARSTQEIAHHIAEVRGATGVSVSAVQHIEHTIGEISVIANAIAAAVEQQGAATAEIARNVNETAVAANDITGRTGEVLREAESTAGSAKAVCEDAAALNTAMAELRNAVIRAVRTSATEVDRRAAPRQVLNEACRISMTGQADHAGTLRDLAEGGARIAGGPALPPGARGVLHLPAAGLALGFVVRGGTADLLHVAFTDPVAADSGLAAYLHQLRGEPAAGGAAGPNVSAGNGHTSASPSPRTAIPFGSRAA